MMQKQLRNSSQTANTASDELFFLNAEAELSTLKASTIGIHSPVLGLDMGWWQARRGSLRHRWH
jgi:hypothetical protein